MQGASVRLPHSSGAIKNKDPMGGSCRKASPTRPTDTPNVFFGYDLERDDLFFNLDRLGRSTKLDHTHFGEGKIHFLNLP